MDFKDQLKKASDPVKEKNILTEKYSQMFSNPYEAAKKGYIDAVIFPHETRKYLIQGLLLNSRKKINLPSMVVVLFEKNSFPMVSSLLTGKILMLSSMC